MEYTKVRKTRMDPAKEAEVLSTNKHLKWIRGYLGKVLSTQALDKVFAEASVRPVCNSEFGSLTHVRLRIFVHPGEEDWVDEMLEVVYDGGEMAHRSVNANSMSANLREIAKLADGGYYQEEQEYDELNSEWWELMFDEKGNPSLWIPEIIGKPAYKDDEEAE